MAGAVVYLACLLPRIPSVVRLVYFNSDAAFAPVLAAQAGFDNQDGAVLVGQAPHYTSIWFLWLSRRLPFRRELWEAAPFVISLLTVAVLAWSVSKIAGKWAGLASGVLALGAGPAVLKSTLAQGMRSHTWLVVVLMPAFLIFLTKASAGSKARVAASAAAIGVVAGVTLASDPLFLLAGLAPFLGSAWLVSYAGRGRNEGSLVSSSVWMGSFALATAWLTSVWMRSMGFTKSPLIPLFAFPEPGVALRNLEVLAVNLPRLTGAWTLSPSPQAALSAAGLLGGVFGLALAIAPARALGCYSKAKAHRNGTETAARLFWTFWALAVFAVGAAFVFGLPPQSPDPAANNFGLTGNTRYLVPFFYAVAASAPAAAFSRQGGKALVAVAAAASCFVAAAGLSAVTSRKPPAILEEGPRITGFLQRQGVERGYTGYWRSHSMTYLSSMKVRFYPVYLCRHPASDQLCGFYVNSRPAWYRPSTPDSRLQAGGGGQKTFLMVDPSETTIPIVRPRSLGRPAHSRRFGAITVHIYNYDIASRLRPPLSLERPARTLDNGA